MKTIKNMCTLGCLAVLFISFSCSNNSPKAAADAFVTHLLAGEFDEAKEYATTDTKSLLSMMESMGIKDQMEDELKGGKHRMGKTEMDGEDKAKVTVTMIGADGEEEDQTYTLIKKDGKWLVNMGKEDTPKEGPKASQAD